MWLQLLLSLLLAVSTAAQNTARVGCFPEPGATEEACVARSCQWAPATQDDPPNTPYCFMNTGAIGYVGDALPDGSIKLSKNRGPANPWGYDEPSLKLTARDIGGGAVNVRIETGTKRYEPPLDLPKETLSSTSEQLRFVPKFNDPFSFAIARSNGRDIFDTSIGGLIFSDKFIQIATYLPSEKMYGWGENIHPKIKHDFTRYTTWGMFARDEGPNSLGLDTKNLYGVHPFYLMVEPDGKAHGVFFVNSNAQEVLTLPRPALVYRTIGGILDIVFFPGPSPALVIQQYLAYVGRPFLPAYWALGYQLCRWGYKNLEEMKTRVAAVRAAGIPIDIAYADIDYMNKFEDFSEGEEWADFPNYVRQLHAWGMRSILIWDPAIEVDYAPFQRAIDQKVSFIEWERADQVQHSIQDQYPMAKDTLIMLSKVWPDRHVAFPDFLDPTNATQQWWSSEFVRFHNEIQFDGAWIDMNEPSSFDTNKADSAHLVCPLSGDDSSFDMPPYKTHAVYNFGKDAYISTKTLCMNGMSARRSERFFNTKNLYGWSETRATQKALAAATGRRGAVISRSTFPSSGRYGGHWLGDNTARWEDLRSAIIGTQEFNMFGIPYVGSDVCGFNGETNEELCLRWQQAGAFHSFFRNHNSIGNPFQDPAVWPSVAAAAKRANLFRYAYLPYLFSLHFRASLTGTTVVRPTFFEFPSDSETFDLSEQFMWGPSILVAPVLYPGATSVEAYIPSSDFFSFYDISYGQPVPLGKNNFQAPTTVNAPTFVRAGSVIPRQQADVTTAATRLSLFSLLIVPSTASYPVSTGELFWDDGEALYDSLDKHNYQHSQFTFTPEQSQNRLQLNTTRAARDLSVPGLQSIEIFAYPAAPSYSSFTLNGRQLGVDTQGSRYNPFTKILTVAFTKPVDFSALGVQTITWTNAKTADNM